ncbi:MAG TPA: hypothetical protein PK770_03070 [Kiritimatiellia bacterium]|jgi:hypothetical protein|nr:hypothetical protein [Kiritimatiellia bacterium]HOM58823.1 hypothetical protein [Kiritimatiellia bacterium]HOR96775.1 hypothetical protein [Kiritimatiellia bacterium]HPC49915.1 hypothetical protein [Kiritimatiellia bacterium]HPK37705.1 hypothetical protein [Kiritimatiellia bacterium]
MRDAGRLVRWGRGMTAVRREEHEDFLGAWIEEFCGMGVPPMKHGQDARAIPAFGVPVILALRWIE